ncbi:tripartite tricarboxylate transporter TctB family protein [Aliirhizobium terrae]|uniref:tripartite tricarboxylate transporter TctB family protein n=1 Tax=Terrirhizobium terrae TaxID=2926709 RepID=UPI00257918F3|nr:tripartite tricarboxylate transporter TctB family protein [Rhizobium sp. CC-CFT758]WJH40992.1 tripartite tricarboxylate transporter TctB family protein [Rhizobium sp. CC-CFT758]
MNSQSIDKANLICGVLLVLTGIFFAYQSIELELGTAFRMGPGYFPFILALALILFGAIILIQAFRAAASEPIGPIAWRGIVFILAAPIFFGITVRGLGFVPALFFTGLIGAFASHKMTPLKAVVLAALLTAFSVLVFSYGLGLPFQRFGPWVRF